IGFNFYTWVALLVCLLLIFGMFPLIGPLKKAEERAANGGPLAPAGSELNELESNSPHLENGKIRDFALPMIVLMVATLALGSEMAYGTIVTVAFMFVFYLLEGSMDAHEFSNVFIKGLSTMIMPLMLMLLAFVFKDVNDQIGFTQYVIETAVKYIPGTLVPVMVFIVLSLTEFISGTNWGMYAIALPIVIPMAQIMGLNMPLCVAAVLSAGVFGSHISICSDCTVLASAACGCDNYEHGRTQMYYGFIEVAISAVIFAICGFVF
ncbi:MAG: Na+/H+ antiporter NhaC family protein, partial [Clostridia bacterium]|nr:Na+/H+ antiporter NhaC family protein [Clostridia bacterium]